MITRFKATTGKEEKIIFINKHEELMGVYQVHIDNLFKGDLYYRWGQWIIKNEDFKDHDDVQLLGRLAKTIG